MKLFFLLTFNILTCTALYGQDALYFGNGDRMEVSLTGATTLSTTSSLARGRQYLSTKALWRLCFAAMGGTNS